MKNMKKILAVGALLAMGTMATGAKEEQEFGIKINVIRTLDLVAETGELDFGVVNSTTVKDIRATDKITVTGSPDTPLSFSVPEDTVITNTNGNDTITIKTFVSDTEDGGPRGSWGELDGEGVYTGYMVAHIYHANLVEGAYTGTVKLEVSYN